MCLRDLAQIQIHTIWRNHRTRVLGWFKLIFVLFAGRTAEDNVVYIYIRYVCIGHSARADAIRMKINNT